VCPLSPEAVTGYPRWQGQLSSAPRIWSIILQETRRAYNDQWGRSALILAFGYSVITIGQLAFAANTRPNILTKDIFLDVLGLLRWVALGMAAVCAGGALLDDDRRGAIELYLSRSVTRWTYLLGKVLAVVGLTFATMFGPALVFYGASFFVFENQPEGWAWVILGAAGFSAIWSLVVAGLGLGISCLVRSSRAASIILFAGVAGMDIVLGKLLSAITKSDNVKVLSLMSDMDQQATWLFNMDAPLAFPWWWGTIALAVAMTLGWALVWLRHPRLRGVN
jgi:ABC-type transport system involved in multi-copper enzyme maturation permease subunit